MNNSLKSIFGWAIAALVCIVMLAVPGYAATPEVKGEFRMGPGDHYDAQGNIVSLDGVVLVTADGRVLVDTAYTLEEPEEPAVPAFAEAETPAAAPAAAEAKASGEAETGVPADRQTVVSPAKTETPASNNKAEIKNGQEVYAFEGKLYTPASSWGIHKLSGYNPTADGYDMTYCGKHAQAKHTVAVASEIPIGTVIILKANSGPYPSEFDGVYVVEDRGGYYIEEEQWVDIFFDTLQEANHVTDAGWNYAEVWIAQEVKE